MEDAADHSSQRLQSLFLGLDWLLPVARHPPSADMALVLELDLAIRFIARPPCS